MSTSTMEVTDPRQDVAKVVDDTWRRLSFERKEWLDKGYQVRRYLSAASTNDTEAGQLPWKNKTTIPKLTQIAETLQSYYMAALIPSDDWFRWEGENADSHSKANLIEAYLGTKLRMSGFAATLETIVKDWIVYGNAFAGVDWLHETKKSLVDGTEVDGYVGPKLVRISPMDCVIDKRAASFDESPFIRRRFVSLSTLVNHNEGDPAIPWDEGQIEEVKKLRRGDRGDWTEYYKESGYQIDGFQAWTDYFQSQYVELLEYYGDIYVASTGEIKRNQYIVVAERAFVLAQTEFPSWTGKKPVAHIGWRVLPDNLYGQGPLDNLAGMQYRCDHLENLKADTFDQIVHPIIKIKGDEVQEFEWGPGVQIFTGQDGDVTILQPDASVLNVNTEIAIYHRLMDEMAGSPKEVSGFRSPGEKTAFEVSTLTQGADRTFQNKLNRFEGLIQRILNLMFEMLIRNMDITDVARVFNDDTKALELTTITKENVTADGTLRPVGSKHFAARAKRIQELQNFMQILANPQIAPHVSGLAAAKAFEEELGFEKYAMIGMGVGQIEAMQLQQMAQALQQGVLGGQGQPVSEEPVDGTGAEGF